MSGTHKTYEKSNNAIRFAAKKVANNNGNKEMTDDEIVETVGREMARRLRTDLERRVCIRAYREGAVQ